MVVRSLANFAAVNAALAVAFAVAASSGCADDVPAGWSRAADGSYIHAASGINCPAELKGYRFKSLDGASAPNFEGVCTYDNGDGETGLIRVRHYVEGAGETPLAIQNDYNLMHPQMSNGGTMVATFRGGPGPVVDGVQTYQIVLTNVMKGFLVDCIARHADKAQPAMDFPLACQHLTGL
jgi:hypothetical protein